jgi:hypothetical protein
MMQRYFSLGSKRGKAMMNSLAALQPTLAIFGIGVAAVAAAHYGPFDSSARTITIIFLEVRVLRPLRQCPL